MATQIDPRFAQFYMDPSAFQRPDSAGMQPGARSTQLQALQGDPLSLGMNALGVDYSQPWQVALNPGAALWQSMFGEKPSWQPYVDAQGNYVFNNPKQVNPVPLANVPGATLKPSKTYRQTAQQAQALHDLFPYISQALAGQIIPQEQAQLAAAQATSDPYAALQTALYKKYGPQLNDIGNQISLQNMLAQASNENKVLQGPGAEEVKSALALAQMQDPEFYNTRAQTAGRIGDLLQSIDLSGNLSPSEQEAIRKGIVQQGVQRGTTNAPSNTETVSNAMLYGNATHQRQLEAQSALGNAIQVANQFLPASRSGVDVFQVATGRSSQPNPGAGYFPGVNNSGQQTFGTLAGLGSGMQSNTNALQQTNNQIQANKKDWLDKFVQFTSGLNNVGSFVGGLTGGGGGAGGGMGLGSILGML